jgi:tight adherence protein C
MRALEVLKRYGRPESGKFEAEAVYEGYLDKLGIWLKKHVPTGMVENLKLDLARGGHPFGLTVERFLVAKASLVVVTFILSLIAFSLSPVGAVLMLLVLPAFYFPDLWLRYIVASRQEAIRLALPNTLDLLTICVEGGLGLDMALGKVSALAKDPLSEEFTIMLDEIRAGLSRREAFANLKKRTTITELHVFITSLMQAEEIGVSIAQVLRSQAAEMRLMRRQQAEETAMKIPVKIVFPVILFMFPAIFVVILGPAIIMIMQSLAGK